MKNRSKARDLYTMSIVSCIIVLLIGLGVVASQRKRHADRLWDLGRSIDSGQSDRVRKLLDAGVDPKELPEPTVALNCAVIYCEPATVQALIDRGLDVNGLDEGSTALSYAVIHRRSDMVEVLLRNAADVRIRPKHAKTLLEKMSQKAHRFARHDNDPKIVRLLQQAERKWRQ